MYAHSIYIYPYAHAYIHTIQTYTYLSMTADLSEDTVYLSYKT